MHKTNCMQSIENISIWEVFSSICPLKGFYHILSWLHGHLGHVTNMYCINFG